VLIYVQRQPNLTNDQPNDRPLVQHINNVWLYRGSNCGICLRALTAARLGYMEASPPAWLLNVARRGCEIELSYKDHRRKSGTRIAAEQVEVRVLVPGTSAIIVGHIDGIEIDKRPYLLEVKSMSEKQFAKWMIFRFEEFPNYLAQISVYAWAIKLPVKYVVIPRHLGIEHANVSYFNRDDIIRFGGGIDKVFDRIRKVEEWAKKRELPECDSDSLYCRFDYLCTNKNRR